MSRLIKKEHKIEWIAGAITLVVALLLIGAVVWVMSGLTLPEDNSPTTAAPTVGTQPTTQPPQSPIKLNPYGPGDFEYENGYLTCVAGKSTLGIDVSEFQGKIDWQTVAQTDVEFAIIRLGFRAWGSKGEITADAYGLENLQGAREAGLKVGVYFFSQAITVEEAREEARFVLQLLDGQALDMPIVFDWETVPDPEARTANITPEKLNACILAFCQEISDVGKKPMIYVSPWFGNMHLDQLNEYPQWLALYKDQMD